MNNWNGELDVDNTEFRKDSFDAWLSWEFLQREIAGCREELNPCVMGELCGKTRSMAKKIHQMAIKHARVTQGV